MIDIRHGDCIEQMRAMEDACVDAIVTDPPYELGFMGKGWDSTGIANSVEMWREALRVLKPGGHLLAFSATRTQHRMVCAIEDAGFEVRDCIRSLNGQDHYPAWAYGTGFPKGLNVVNNLIRLALCQSKDRARLAAQCSVSTLVSCDGAKERIVVAGR
jgi:23S rRNA G2069 N7-methylase RlmK/C1962 C5-methylase RlmI